MHPNVLVAVTATTRVTDGIERVRLNQSYVHAIERSGLVPVVVPPLQDVNAAATLLEACHGLVLTGGEDIDPALYDAPVHGATNPPHHGRDAFEIALAEAARKAGTPTLAICRGIQLVNVALGGSLVQDIPSEWSHPLAHEPGGRRDTRSHSVHVASGSQLAGLLGELEITVNSSHHQAVRRVAHGLTVNALADDGVIEGLEWQGIDWWMIAVQWHPEELVDTPEPWDRRLFDAFAAVCAERAPQHT